MRCFSASAVLMNPATPAAVETWPMLVLTNPSPQIHNFGCRCTEDSRKRCQFHCVSQYRALTVGFYVADVGRRNARHRLGLSNNLYLSLDRRRGVTGLESSVVVHRGAQNHCVNRVIFSQRVFQAHEQDYSHAFCEGGSASLGVKGAAAPIGRKERARQVKISIDAWDCNRDSSTKRGIAFAGYQALASKVDGNQGR